MTTNGRRSDGDDAASPERRRLLWDACLNVRDLGGLRAGEHQVRARTLVRASMVGSLSRAGAAAMRECGVRTVVDLRWPQEVAARPSHFATAVHYVNVPIDEAREIDLYLGLVDGTMPEQVRAIAAPTSGVRDAIVAVAEAEPAVLLHCGAGLDRTGLIVALILGTIGVGESDIVADYGASDAELESEYARLLATAPDRHSSLRERVRRREEMMRTFLSQVRSGYGDASSFLASIGVPPGTVGTLRRMLLV